MCFCVTIGVLQAASAISQRGTTAIKCSEDACSCDGVAHGVVEKQIATPQARSNMVVPVYFTSFTLASIGAVAVTVRHTALGTATTLSEDAAENKCGPWGCQMLEPAFDPTSPLTSYTDWGDCGPRGADDVSAACCRLAVVVFIRVERIASNVSHLCSGDNLILGSA